MKLESIELKFNPPNLLPLIVHKSLDDKRERKRWKDEKNK